MRVRVIAIVCAALLGTAGSGQAQTPGTGPSPGESPAASPESGAFADELALTRASIEARRQAIVSMAMDLDQRQTRAFWPLYGEYRAEMGKVNDRMVSMLTTYLDNYPDLSETLAGQLLDEALRIEQARASIRTKYMSRLRKVLPDRKVARFFQVDHKLEAVINAELAERVPLVE
jgi:hypothetical protein